MAICININSLEYQSLKERAGISELLLQAVCRDYLEKYNRFPHLDELPNSNSEQHLRKLLNVKQNDGIKISDLLEVTGKETVEEAVIDINNQYRDLETKVLPIKEEAIVDIVHRPTTNNFDNWTEEDEILARAPRDENGNLLAPNGNPSNLTEKLYVLVRTKAFKNWFGDWLNNPAKASKVVDENGEPLVVYHGTNVENITIFDRNKGKEHGTFTATNRLGSFFTDIKSEAEGYANITWLKNLKEGKPTVYEGFVNIKSPLYFNNIHELRTYMMSDVEYNEKGDPISKVIIDEKYDGVIVKQVNKSNLAKEIIVRKPNQIKSATSNSGSFNRFNRDIYDKEPNGYAILNNALLKLAELYGIKFNEVTDAELNSDLWTELISDASSVNAFVYNGQIYINIDRANLDAPIHEMFHILVGSMRFENPMLYQSLIKSVENLKNYLALVQQYRDRSRNDINEEIFITELARYLSGMPSELMNLDLKSLYELNYNIKRTLDTILMGEDSVRTISDDRLYNMTLKEVIEEVNSSLATSNFRGFINIEGSELHRTLNNIKSDLFKNKQLEEICD